MPIRHAIWTIGPDPKPLAEATLASEQLLENLIVARPGVLSDEWLLIGRQEDTGFGGRIDLLAMAPDGTLILIELKRDRTPREVVAQALDYASWVEQLRPEEIAAIYGRFAPGRSLAEDFKARFGQDLDEDAVNSAHEIVIVASALDQSTERIVGYLNARDIAINVLFFQVFAHGTDQLLSRAWLLDPVPVQAPKPGGGGGPGEPWNGEFYGSFGAGPERSWEEARRYGFFCAGGGTWYTQTLKRLKPGDRLWVKVPQQGFVGVGRVAGPATAAAEFTVKTPNGEVPVLDVATEGHYHRDLVDDGQKCEYFVPMQWLETVPISDALYEIGLFGNQNSVCQPTDPKWRSTVERLKLRFPTYDEPSRI